MNIILYCDFTGLCTSFGESFRKLYPLEPIKNVINRNKKYWFLTKYLRECVEIYGYPGYGKTKISGPFYCGLSYIMVIL